MKITRKILSLSPGWLKSPIVMVASWAKSLLGSIDYAISYVRRNSYIVDRWEGNKPLDAEGGKVVVFVHYDRRGVLHDFVEFQLTKLVENGFRIIFVSNSPKLAQDAVERLIPLCATIVRRRNVGYDFGAYKEGIALIPDVTKLDALILANDSVYGPLQELSGVIASMDPDVADIWSITDSWSFSFHLQSYFLLIHKKALAHPQFEKFWSELKYLQTKDWIVQIYEVGFTRQLRRAGLRCRAAYPYRQAAEAVVDTIRRYRVLEVDQADRSTGISLAKAFQAESRREIMIDPVQRNYLIMLFHAINAGIPLNGTHFFWDYMIDHMRCPFIKRDLLQQNPAEVPYLIYWERVINNVSDYDTDLIVKHLELTLRKRSI